MDIPIGGASPITNVVVCHSNRMLVSLGKLQAERHGVRIHVARNGRSAAMLAHEKNPELIVLSSDLKNPTTEETIALLQADPVCRGIRVVTVKGSIPNLRDMLGRFPGP